MELSAFNATALATPAVVLDEPRLLSNLHALANLRQQSGCKLLYSIKSLPFSTVLALAKTTVDGFSVSSLFEAKLAAEILAPAGSIHLTTPGIRADELTELASVCTHISLNSLSQQQRFAEPLATQTSVGLRVNPKLSFVKDDRYNPCRRYSKLGIDIDDLWLSANWAHIQGLHVHTNFSATDTAPLLATIAKLKLYVRDRLHKLRWLNLGGGYLYHQLTDKQAFIEQIGELNQTFGLDVYIEPGKAVLENVAYLVASVIDLLVSDGKTIAILDTSVNHHPEVFEYQLQPAIAQHHPQGRHTVLLAGSTCLAGDIFGEYRFTEPLRLGDRIVFLNIGAYSLVKASRFNGYNLPTIYGYNAAGFTRLKHYSYSDYRQQWLAD